MQGSSQASIHDCTQPCTVAEVSATQNSVMQAITIQNDRMQVQIHSLMGQMSTGAPSSSMFCSATVLRDDFSGASGLAGAHTLRLDL